MRRIAVLDAPSNLGLRPPTATSVPGCAKAPGALRDHGLLGRLGARDAGCLTPPRYDPGDWRPGDGVAHAAQIAAYSRALADRIGRILDAGEFPVVLGGDCSILLGSGLAMHRLGEAVGGRIGLVFVDGHSDFRHPGNASYVGAAAGEDLALVTGRGQADLAAIEGRRPYFRDIDVVVLGIRAQDEYRLDLQAAGIVTRPVPALRAEGAARSAQWARDQLVDCAGYWLHVDVDVLDPAVLPAVDAPSPGGIAFPELELLLAGLVESPHCLGVEITVFDPDYDPDGVYAREITSTVAAGLAAARTVIPRPDLAAARADLTNAPRGVRPGQEEPAPEVADTDAPPDRFGGPEPATSAADRAASGLAVVRARAAKRTHSDPTDLTDISGPAQGADLSDSLVLTDISDLSDPADGAASAKSSGVSEISDLVERSSLADESGLVKLADSLVEPDLPYMSGFAEAPGLAEAPGFAEVPGFAEAPGLVDEANPAAEAPAVGSEEAVDLGIAVGLEGAEAADEVLESLSEAEKWGEIHADGEVAEPVRLVSRPLGQAPLLDSEPLPATRPGMLRPRPAEEHADSFSLPAQRPAFDLGSGEPADVV